MESLTDKEWEEVYHLAEVQGMIEEITKANTSSDGFVDELVRSGFVEGDDISKTIGIILSICKRTRKSWC